MIIKSCSKVGCKLRLLSVIQSIWGCLLLLVGLKNMFSIFSKIGCGRKKRLERKIYINCWERSFDKISGSSNSYVCDELFSTSDIVFVSDLIHHDIRFWNAPLINDFLIPFEAQQILQLSISFSQLQNKFVWGASQLATFL